MRKYKMIIPVYMLNLRPNWPEIAPEEIMVTVTYNYTPPFAGNYDEPPHGCEIDILSACGEDKTEVPQDIYEYLCKSDWCQEMLREHAENDLHEERSE